MRLTTRFHIRYSHRVGNLDERESKANNEVTTYSDSYANWIIIVTRTNTRNSVLNKDVDQIHRCCVTYQDFVAGMLGAKDYKMR